MTDEQQIEEIKILAKYHGIPDGDHIHTLHDAVEVAIEIIDWLAYEAQRQSRQLEILRGIA